MLLTKESFTTLATDCEDYLFSVNNFSVEEQLEFHSRVSFDLLDTRTISNSVIRRKFIILTVILNPRILEFYQKCC